MEYLLPISISILVILTLLDTVTAPRANEIEALRREIFSSGLEEHHREIEQKEDEINYKKRKAALAFARAVVLVKNADQAQQAKTLVIEYCGEDIVNELMRNCNGIKWSGQVEWAPLLTKYGMLDAMCMFLHKWFPNEIASSSSTSRNQGE